MGPFDTEREADTAGPSTACHVFAWIGQPFDTCDDCSEPYWLHLYEVGTGQLRVKQWRSYEQRWVWIPAVPITRAKANQVRLTYGHTTRSRVVDSHPEPVKY